MIYGYNIWLRGQDLLKALQLVLGYDCTWNCDRWPSPDHRL